MWLVLVFNALDWVAALLFNLCVIITGLAKRCDNVITLIVVT